MKSFCLFVTGLILLTGIVQAQKVIELPMPVPSGTVKWTEPERQYVPDSNSADQFAENVSQPTLTVYMPKTEIANGVAVIVCPGGGFTILSMFNEGRDVAKYLNDKGFTAFVLKYRLIPKTAQPALAGTPSFGQLFQAVLPLSDSDGLTALDYVREHAKEFNVNPKRIGIMGFSAGGQVAANAALNYTETNRPDFAAPIYPYVGALKGVKVRDDAPPLFIAAASNDALVGEGVKLYTNWLTAGKLAELHIFSKGGHGFGMKKQNLPTDDWIERFYAFLKQEVLK